MRRPLRRTPRGLPLRAVAPNAVTALALCFGLSGIRFAISSDWEAAVTMIMIAGVLDGLDGRIARMLHGESRFGAELDSLSDAISFGVSPALILYLWSLRELPRIGWLCALIFAVFCALRLARFNAQIDLAEQPHKSAGFLTGAPAPAGAVLAMLPLYLWFWSGEADLPLDLDRRPLGRALRRPDGVERRHLFLVVAEAPAPYPLRGAGDRRPAGGGAGVGPVAHAVDPERRLYRFAALQHESLCPGQAAARSIRGRASGADRTRALKRRSLRTRRRPIDQHRIRLRR